MRYTSQHTGTTTTTSPNIAAPFLKLLSFSSKMTAFKVNALMDSTEVNKRKQAMISP